MQSTRNYDMFEAACSTRQAITCLSDKWTMLLLMALAEQPYQFGQLRRKVECISQKMLTQTLRKLEAKGLVKRYVGDANIVTVVYSLTPLGESLIGPLESLQQWAMIHGNEMSDDAPNSYDEKEHAPPRNLRT